MKTKPFTKALIGISPLTSFMAQGSPKRKNSRPRSSAVSNSMSRYRI